jgi:hypothetical protein
MCEGARIRRHHQRIEAARAAQVKKCSFDEVCRKTSNLEFWYAIRGTAPESVKSSRGGLFQGVTSSGLVNTCANYTLLFIREIRGHSVSVALN